MGFVRRRVQDRSGLIRNTLIVRQLAELLERLALEQGNFTVRGERRIVFSRTLKSLAVTFKVSIGTLQNTFRALITYGHIIAHHKSYVLVRPNPLSEAELHNLETVSPDANFHRTVPLPPEHVNPMSNIRLSEREVRYLYTDILRTQGREVAGEVLRCHRLWSRSNGFEPWL